MDKKYKECAIVIPIYKSELNDFEKTSLLRCKLVLNEYDIFLATPEGLDITPYNDLLGLNLFKKEFKRKYFKSLVSYNKLLLSKTFYTSFQDYKYILIYHTDAYVFKNELEEWCKKDYDYIGAPIYEFDGTIAPQKFIGIGNGGFALHKIKSAIKVLSTYKVVYKLSDLWKWYSKYNFNGRVRYLPYFIKVMLGFGRNAHKGLNNLKLNEDVFWGVYVPRAFPDYRIASFEDAYKFSMEFNCEKLFELNNEQLPFGCHGWYKELFINFWKDKISLE
jgi:hypothetical protein